jgi:transposase
MDPERQARLMKSFEEWGQEVKMEQKRTLRRLSQHEYFQLCTWLQQNHMALLPGCTYESLAKTIGQQLNLELAASSVADAMKNMKLKLPKQKRDIPPNEAIAILAKHLIALYHEDNEAIPEELKELL